MDRRELLKQAARLMGGAVSAPVIAAALSGCASSPSTRTSTVMVSTSEWKPQFLSPAQIALVAEVAQIIIPRTDTPGAIEAGVPTFIDNMLKDTYPKADQDRYLSGLTEFDAASRTKYGKQFVDLDTSKKQALVQQVHDAALTEAGKSKSPVPRPFILMTKELTLLGFFMSHPGSTQVLQYVAIPGKYEACIPLSQTGNGRAWAIETAMRF